MQERHINRLTYFNEQAYTTEKYLIPFISDKIEISDRTRILEIGCGEGGNLKPFLDIGCQVVGVDLAKNKIENAISFYSDHPNCKNALFMVADIYEVDTIGQFDFIMMRDVLEHIHDQRKFMDYVKKFLKPDGKIFLGFPPWVNPFGGHQQGCRSKVLSMLPFFHILPKPIYRFILKGFGETPVTISSLLETKSTAISIQRFERIIKQTNYKKEKRLFYFINPNYEVKFKLKPRVISPVLGAIPYLRDFFITTNYYLLTNNNPGN